MKHAFRCFAGVFFSWLPCIGLQPSWQDTTEHNHSYHTQEIIITATRSPIERSHSPAAVSVISDQFLRQIGMPSLGTTLCYVPGVRTEVNCQTCNYSQVRLNGLAGAYTQILINGRPIVSPLVSLYGLDQFPTAMLERIEVLRGSASVLYGSSAIAGVINLVTRDRWEQGGSITTSLSLIGESTPEIVTNAALVLGDDQIGSLALTVHYRMRDGYDANADGFTELPRLRNMAIGANAMFPLSDGLLQTSLTLINEERRGGNRLDEPPDRADQAEYRNHDIFFLTTSYSGLLGKHRYELYTAVNATERLHYTGVDQADGWGRTRSLYGITGGQLTLAMPLRTTVGVEYLFEHTMDAIKAYGYAVDQQIGQGGIFAQVSGELLRRFSLLVGMRIAWHNAVSGVVVLRRGALLWRPAERWDFRLNYGEGFRAPQVFETDMHIAFASGGVSFIRIEPQLRRESASSLSLSLTHRFQHDELFAELCLDGFATHLRDPFVLKDDGLDTNGNRMLVRTNGTAAYVVGVSWEGQLQWQAIALSATLTLQRSWYQQPVEWSQQEAPERRFLRTPDLYGSATVRLPIDSRWEVVGTAILTGSMVVPHMALGGDRLVLTPAMLDVSMMVRYYLRPILSEIGNVALAIRISNVFNAYQQDFDRGRYRDSNYIWGPPQPRTVGVELQWMFSTR